MDSTCQKWFDRCVSKSKRADGKYRIDRKVRWQDLHLESRRVGDFHYWRPRLLQLEKELNNSSPRTLKAWYRDRRKTREWATFWTACGAVVLSLLALILAALSAYYGAVSTNEAILANAYASNASTWADASLQSVISSTDAGVSGIHANGDCLALAQYCVSSGMITAMENSISLATKGVPSAAIPTLGSARTAPEQD